MISLETYKIIHLMGGFFLIFALGGLTLHKVNGGDRSSNRGRFLVALTHGFAMITVLAAGMGLMSRLQIPHAGPWPLWIKLKLGIWLLMGLALAALYRINGAPRILWFVLPLLGGLAGWLAINKPL